MPGTALQCRVVELADQDGQERWGLSGNGNLRFLVGWRPITGWLAGLAKYSVFCCLQAVVVRKLRFPDNAIKKILFRLPALLLIAGVAVFIDRYMPKKQEIA
jgi:hypothetical protein